MTMVHDLEVEALMTERRETAAQDALRQWAELEDEQENDRQTLRRWLANAFIQIGVKIDPLAAEDLGSADETA